MSADEKDCITVDLSGLVFESNEGSSTQQGEGSAEKANEGTKSNTTASQGNRGSSTNERSPTKQGERSAEKAKELTNTASNGSEGSSYKAGEGSSQKAKELTIAASKGDQSSSNKDGKGSAKANDSTTAASKDNKNSSSKESEGSAKKVNDSITAASKGNEGSAKKANEDTNATTAASKGNGGSSSGAFKEPSKTHETPVNPQRSSASIGQASSSTSQPPGYIAPRASPRIPAIHGRSRGYDNQLYALALRHERLKKEAVEKKKAEEKAAAENNNSEENSKTETKTNADEKTEQAGESKSKSSENAQSDEANKSGEQDSIEVQIKVADEPQTVDDKESDIDLSSDSDDSEVILMDVMAKVDVTTMASEGIATEDDGVEDDFTSRIRQRRAEAIERGIVETDLFLGFKTVTWGWIIDRVRAANRPLLDIILQYGEDPRMYDYTHLIDDSTALEDNPEKYETAFAQLDAGLEPLAFTRKRPLEDIVEHHMSKKMKTSTDTAQHALRAIINQLGPGDEEVKKILSRRLQRRGEDDGSWRLAVSRLIDDKEDDVRYWMHLVQSRINLRVRESVLSEQQLKFFEKQIEGINSLRGALDNIQ